MPSPRGVLKRATRRKVTASFSPEDYARLGATWRFETLPGKDLPPWWARISLSSWIRWVLLERAGLAEAIATAGPAGKISGRAGPAGRGRGRAGPRARSSAQGRKGRKPKKRA
jgi:hypothetical protein